MQKIQKCTNKSQRLVTRAKIRSLSTALLDLSWEHRIHIILLLCLCICLQMTRKASQIPISGIQVNFSEGKYESTELVNNEGSTV